jgi:topoisomerase-4 subunit A
MKARSVLAVLVLAEGQKLTVQAGSRHITLKASDLEVYRGERGRRGAKLPRGFQKVDGMRVGE